MEKITIEVNSAEFELRGKGDDCALVKKSPLSSSIQLNGLTVSGESSIIYAHIEISADDKGIKDHTNSIESDATGADYSIDFKAHGWLHAPKTYWGYGYLVENQLWLKLHCTIEEFALIESILFATGIRPPLLECSVSYPDHSSEPEHVGSGETEFAGPEVSLDRGTFCIAGWNLRKQAIFRRSDSAST